MEFDLENPMTHFEEHQPDTIPALFATESDHMPFGAHDFFLSHRPQAISLILQVQFSCNLDPCISYLALTYVDRFISKQEILLEDKPWILKLLVISSLSLAAKMKNTNLSLSDFQREEGLIFDTQTIQRTELLILSTLNWRMRSITPFSFLSFFISLFKLKDPPLMQALKARATQIIFRAHHEMKLLEFKPSIIAASALLSAAYELFPLQFPCFQNSLAACEFVNKERLLGCLGAMQGMAEMDGCDESTLDTVSNAKTPVSVLDGQYCGKSESESTVMQGREIKRRRVGHLLQR
ncbi:putative cyclin-D6-1 [Malania oleifera]|uniref:putative cyclin-D6-1 n=1 Tax=Malania oleifera TaxID=397392 RepID=UPI0025AE0621|nr:putative cyclin-D6-1 [Malania oleifera]